MWKQNVYEQSEYSIVSSEKGKRVTQRKRFEGHALLKICPTGPEKSKLIQVSFDWVSTKDPGAVKMLHVPRVVKLNL